MATLTGSAGNAPQRFASLSGIRRSGSGFEMDGMFRAHTSRDDRRDREGRVNAPPDRVFPPPEETELANLETEHPVRGPTSSWLLTGRRVSIDHVGFRPGFVATRGAMVGSRGPRDAPNRDETPRVPGIAPLLPFPPPSAPPRSRFLPRDYTQINLVLALNFIFFSHRPNFFLCRHHRAAVQQQDVARGFRALDHLAPPSEEEARGREAPVRDQPAVRGVRRGSRGARRSA